MVEAPTLNVPRLAPAYLLTCLGALFYALSWWIAPIAILGLFGPVAETVRSFWRVGCAIALLASAACILDSFKTPSHGHKEYSVHSSEWVEE
jgi:hypothetical protein